MNLGGVITGTVASLVYSATNRLFSSIGWLRGLEGSAERLNRSLNRFHTVVAGAEETSKGREYLQLWHLDIRDLMYDVEDLLDEMSYESVKKKVKNESTVRKRKLSEMIGLSETDFDWNFNWRQLISRMSERAASLDKWADRVLSHVSLENMGGEPDFGNRVPTSSLLCGEMTFGRDEDKSKLIEFLESDTYNISNRSVIALVGMPGIGKTTLAQLVINDESVRYSFGFIAWIHVSHNFDIVRLTKSLIESIECQTCNLVQLDALQKKLRELVRGRRVLLVLDDVWNENLHLWQVFASPLRGERIKMIVTTQNESVAAVMQTVPPFKLKMLGEDECVQMLKYHAFGGGIGIQVIQDDEDIGKRLPPVGLENDSPNLFYDDFCEAAKKCQGLPLAIKELGYRIYSVTTRYETQDKRMTWRDAITDALTADFNPAIEFTTGMFSSVKLSYDLLPPNLKRCIAYCALFPEGYTYEKDHLARLWAALGYAQFERGASLGHVTRFTREDVCHGYFDELVRRSFFLPLDSTNGLSLFKMHCLIHSLCKFVSAGEADSYEENELLQGCLRSHRELRHLFVASNEHVVIPNHVRLRTYICDDFRRVYLSEILLNLKYVRSLVINSSDILVLPDSFGTLKYLKYLRLCSSVLRELPKSIGNLYNLQMLDLSGCMALSELPPSIGNLFELWFLGLPPVESRGRVGAIESACLIPPEIGRLTSLRALRVIVLGREFFYMASFGIRDLERLDNLQELYIDGLANVTNVDDAIEADMKAKKFLEILRLQWREPADGVSCRRFGFGDDRLLENLEPHKNLGELVIIGYDGGHFPSWMSDSYLSNLTKMTLLGCKRNECYSLPLLGQLPSLKCLSIGWMPMVWRVGVEFLHAGSSFPTSMKTFPCLVELSFEEMHSWTSWCDVGHEDFRVLRKLTINNCGNLMELPHFPSLVELFLTGCDGLKDFLLCNTQYNQILRREKTQVDKIAELPPTSSVADSLLPHSEKDKQKSTLEGLVSDDYHPDSENFLPPIEKGKQKSTIEELIMEEYNHGNPDNSLPHNEVEHSPICGREDDTNRILKILLSDKSGERNSNVTFMCVVAPSGVGKTTIIHQIFNNCAISEAFYTRIWVCISGVLDEKTLMKEIIESITQISCVRADLALLHEIVQEELSGKKFLLILDGAQNDDRSFWSNVIRVLDGGAKGSMAVVATNNQVVADATGSEHCHRLDYLSDDNCWSLFGSLNPKFPSYLKERCRHLVIKCKGIPLCVKMIAGCFHNGKTEERVTALSTSEYWEFPALRVSYEFLPLELRKCFDYCALFPKNHVFVKDHIVRLWISQGFIGPIGGGNLEVIGNRYFDELVLRSFLHISPIHDEKDGNFLIHELVHDLALCDIPHSNFFRPEDYSQSAPSNVSHLVLAPNEFKEVDLRMVTKEIVNLETLLVVNQFAPWLYNVGSPVANLLGLNDLFDKHKNIKTLDLGDTNTEELPESIGLVKSLRFLRISNTKIKNIPPQICVLPELLTLEARNCCYLVELPIDLKKLTSLRHLDTRKESGFVAIPKGISHLTNLRTLPAFNVGNDKSHSSIGELRNLKHLKGELHIIGIENIRELNEAKEAELESKNFVECLILQWCGSNNGDETRAASPLQVLGFLQPPSNLQEMVIRNYTHERFPLWMEKRYLPKLVSVTLDNCFRCVKFPYLGNLPSLKYLCAQKMHLVETLTDAPVASTSTNSPKFQFLEVLKLSEMYGLKDIFQLENGDFPRLRSLSINKCPMLGKIPGFPSLVELSLSCCTNLPDISDLSSVKFLKIDRVENLERVDLQHMTNLKKLEIGNCRLLSSVILREGVSTVKPKFFRCPKLDQGNASDQGESQPVPDASQDPTGSSVQDSEEIDDYEFYDY